MTFHSFVKTLRPTCIALGTLLAITSVSGKSIPTNLGYGLDKLVESNQLLKNTKDSGVRGGRVTYNGYATRAAALYAERAISTADGRFMVDITLNGTVPFTQVRDSLTSKFKTLQVTSVDAKYRNSGIIEGLVSLDQVSALASTAGVKAVFLSLKPNLVGATKGGGAPNIGPMLNLNSVGSKFDQGVTQHRVDKISQIYDPSAPLNYDGSGITVGVLSDSFDTRGSGSTAASAMATFDLPGAGNNPYNTQPVVVLQDDPGQTDEGRGMAEIVYKMAPRAKIGFATADKGEVGFANNIRALSGKFPSVPNTQAGFQASVICDDVSYGGEPVFADGGVIAQGVDDVAGQGVSYFSSAGNSYGVSAINSPLRWVPNGTGNTAATNAALVGTNIDLTNVPTEFYQGGFHNWNPNPGSQDVACLWNVSAGGALAEIQWNDPYDSNPAVNQPAIFTGNGNVTTANQVVNFGPFNFTANQQYVVKVAADNSNIDVVVTVTRNSDNKLIIRQDTGTDELLNFFPPTTDSYTIGVTGLDGSTGAFTITINTGNGMPLLSTDINLLVFDTAGHYIPDASLTTNNIANNRPVEIGVPFSTGGGQCQFVIARSFTPTAPHPADYLRCSTGANSNPNNAPAEYFDYLSSVTGGHNTAAGSNGCAAYDVFRPNVPQNFTSAGPNIIFFDKNQNRLATPELRLTPNIAAANDANTTWLSGDSPNDVDTGGGQFGGTSASAPHAGGIAALIQQAHGGPNSVGPAQMRTILQNTAFTHDLDPYTATGSARSTNGGKVTVTIMSDQTAPNGQLRGRNDPNSHQIAYIGPSSINTFVFNPSGLASEGGATTSGRNGVDASNNYFSVVTPGMYFANAAPATGATAFAFGNSTGLTAGDVTPALSNPAPAPASATGQGQTLTLTFAAGSFAGGDTLHFTIGRGLIRGPNVANANGTSVANYNADNFGGGVLIPEGTVFPDGMRFSGTLADGSTFNGRMKNRLGKGYSNVDGYGFINAEDAVKAPLPPATKKK